MVAGKHRNIFGVPSAYKIKVLVNGIRRSAIPVAFAAALIGRQYKSAAPGAVKVPALSAAYVLRKHKRLILGKNPHGINAGMDAV